MEHFYSQKSTFSKWAVELYQLKSVCEFDASYNRMVEMRPTPHV